MRLIGHLPDETSATRFNDFLCVEGISGQIEADQDGWAVWVHAEEELDRARELLSQYASNPADARFVKSARHARQLREEATREEAEARRRFFDRKQIFRSLGGYRVGWLTLLLIAICLGVAWQTGLRDRTEVVRALQIAGPFGAERFLEVRAGQWWRLFTPVLLHFGWLHLLMNMLCLFDLGGMVEGRQGAGRLALLVGVIGVASNMGQYLVSGPNFGGMSGVIYGLLGYIWIRGKYDPASGLFLHPTTVAMMLAWFFLCLAGTPGNIANATHVVGLILGAAWGFLGSLRPRSRG